MLAYLMSKFITLVYGMLYPAYCSYKAVKTKDVKEYVHWMMYWIVFAIFSFVEIFADTFIGCWFPFYYELKIIFMFWMLSPTTRGGSILYRRYIHPMLTRHEHEIDAYLADFKLRTGSMVVQWGAKAFACVTELLMSTALRAGDYHFINQLRRTTSLDDMNNDYNQNNQPTAQNPDRAEVEELISRRNVHKEHVQPRINIAQMSDEDDEMDETIEIEVPKVSTKTVAQNEPVVQSSRTRSNSRKKLEFGNYPEVNVADIPLPLLFNLHQSPADFTSSDLHYSFSPAVMSSSMPIIPKLNSGDEYDSDDAKDEFMDCEESKTNGDVSEVKTEVESKDVDIKKETTQHKGYNGSEQQISKLSPTVDSGKPTLATTLPVAHGSSVSLTALTKLNKPKVRKSLSQRSSSSHAKSVSSLWSSSSFRRVLNPFSSKPSVSSRSKNKNTDNSSSGVEDGAAKKKQAVSKSELSNRLT